MFIVNFCVIILVILVGASPLFGTNAGAATKEIRIIIKDHKFIPSELKISAGEKVRLIIVNEDPTPEEFESYDFNREKIVSGNSQIKIFVGPLKPGIYKFFGEFNMDTAQGRLIVE